VSYFISPILPLSGIKIAEKRMSRKPPREDVDWKAAEEALAAARQMQGPERFGALKKAGQLRYDAHKKRLSKFVERDDPRLVEQPIEGTPQSNEGTETQQG
jgi:hypothetical protein